MRFVALFLSIALLAGCGFSSKWVVPIKKDDYGTLGQSIAESNDIDERDQYGQTPLHHAAKEGNLKAIRMLLDAGADIYALDNVNRTALAFAVDQHNINAAKLLIDSGWNGLEETEHEDTRPAADFEIVLWLGKVTPKKLASRIEALEYLYGTGYKPTKKLVQSATFLTLPPELTSVILQSGGKKFINQATGLPGARTVLFDQQYSGSIQLLVQYGADVTLKNDQGNTAFHHAVFRVVEPSADYYLDRYLQPFFKAGLNPYIKNRQGITVAEYAYRLGVPQVIQAMSAYENQYANILKADQQFKSCESSKVLEAKADCYQTFASKHSDHAKASLAQARYESLNKKRLVILEKKKKQQRLARIKRQACKLKNQDWEYLSKACKNGYAHGSGTAINEEKNLKFVGEFKAGLRVQGEIFAYGNLMYDGPLKNDRPHGKGICMHEGEPEDCNYYKGKRTDVLYKQRIEFAKQRELLASTEKRINDSLKETESNIDKKLANIQTGSGNVSQGTSATDMVTEALKKKAADKAADFLFDQLF